MPKNRKDEDVSAMVDKLRTVADMVNNALNGTDQIGPDRITYILVVHTHGDRIRMSTATNIGSKQETISALLDAAVRITDGITEMSVLAPKDTK